MESHEFHTCKTNTEFTGLGLAVLDDRLSLFDLIQNSNVPLHHFQQKGVLS